MGSNSWNNGTGQLAWWEHIVNFATLGLYGAISGIHASIAFQQEEDLSVSNDFSTVEQIPTISGAKNRSQYGKPYPFILGRTLYTPSMLGSQKTPYFYTIGGVDGEEQYFNGLYLLGYNDLTVKDIKMGNTLISSNSLNEYNQILSNNNIEYNKRNGNCFQIEIQNRNECSLIPQKVFQESINVELPCSSDENSNIISVPITRFSSPYPQKVEVEFAFNGGLYLQDNDGKKERSVAIAVEYSIDGGNNWLPFGKIGADQTNITYDSTGATRTNINGISQTTGEGHVGASIITRNKLKQMRFVASKTFNKSEVISNGKCKLTNNVIEIRITRTSPILNSSDSRAVDTVYLTAIRTWCFNFDKSKSSSSLVAESPMIEKDRKRTTRMAIKVKSDENIKGQIDSINAILTSKARYCTVTVEGGEKKYTWSDRNDLVETNNPASLALLALQSTMRGGYYDNDYNWVKGKYEYDDSRLDLTSFGKCWEMCDEKDFYKDVPELQRFSCNGALTSKKKTNELIENILATCRSSMVLKGRKYGIISDVAKDEPVFVLNNQNVISAENKKVFNEDNDGYAVKFVNEDNNFSEDDVVVLANYSDHTIYDPDLNLTSAEMLFVTNYYQLWANIRYKMACERLRKETWVRTVGTEGNLIELGDLVELQDDTILVGIGDGAEIKNIVTSGNYITKIVTDGSFSKPDSTKTYGLKILMTDGLHNPKVRTVKVSDVIANGNNETTFVLKDKISLDETILPSVYDIVSFGEYSKITIQGICAGKKADKNGTFTLTFTPYDSHIYTVDVKAKGEFPSFNSKVTLTDTVTVTDPVATELNKLSESFANSVVNLQDQIDNIEFEANTGDYRLYTDYASFYTKPDNSFEPSEIRFSKMKTVSGEKLPTNYGKVLLSIDGKEEKEIDIIKDTEDVYSENKNYMARYEPFAIKIAKEDDEDVILSVGGVAIIGYARSE